MLVTLDHFLEPDSLGAGTDADPWRGLGIRAQVGGEQPRADQDIPTATGGVEPQGEHGGRRQTPARVRVRDQMQAERPPTRHGVIVHQLEGARRRTRDEAEPGASDLKHRTGSHLRQQHHMQHAAPPAA